MSARNSLLRLIRQTLDVPIGEALESCSAAATCGLSRAVMVYALTNFQCMLIGGAMSRPLQSGKLDR